MPSLSCAQHNRSTKVSSKAKHSKPASTHLDLLLDVLDGVRRLDVQSDGLAGQGLDEDLHAAATAQTQNQVQGRLLLDFVVGQGAAILQLLASEDEALLIRGNALLVLCTAQSQHQSQLESQTLK